MSTEHMKSVADYFEQILSRLLSAEDTAARDLNHFSDRDWSRVCKFNSTTPQAHDRCIHEVIHEQVLARPESEAVCAWDGSLTYQDLDVLSSQLAHHLHAHGVGPETCVALCFNKSVSQPSEIVMAFWPGCVIRRFSAASAFGTD